MSNMAINAKQHHSKKDKRVIGNHSDYQHIFNVTSGGAGPNAVQFNLQNHGPGSGQKINQKSITKSNFYNSGFQNTLGQ